MRDDVWHAVLKKSKFFPPYVREFLTAEKNSDVVTDFKTKLRSSVNGSVIVINKGKPLKLLDLAGVSDAHDQPKTPILPWPAPFEHCGSCGGTCSMDKPEKNGNGTDKRKDRFAYRDDEDDGDEDEEVVFGSPPPASRRKSCFDLRAAAVFHLNK